MPSRNRRRPQTSFRVLGDLYPRQAARRRALLRRKIGAEAALMLEVGGRLFADGTEALILANTRQGSIELRVSQLFWVLHSDTP